MNNIVLCGSMVFIDKMKECAKSLSENGFAPIIPSEDNWGLISESERNEYKRRMSRNHFDKVADQNTYGILVVNESKNEYGAADWTLEPLRLDTHAATIRHLGRIRKTVAKKVKFCSKT